VRIHPSQLGLGVPGRREIASITRTKTTLASKNGTRLSHTDQEGLLRKNSGRTTARLNHTICHQPFGKAK
jgi:hypothetical protein